MAYAAAGDWLRRRLRANHFRWLPQRPGNPQSGGPVAAAWRECDVAMAG
jgi:hypothetical protein